MINYTAILTLKDGKLEEKVTKNKTIYYCHHYKKYSLRKNYTTVTYNKKNTLVKSQVTLKSNLTTLLSKINKNNFLFNYMKLRIYSHTLPAESNVLINKGSVSHISKIKFNYDAVSITNYLIR